MAQFDLSCIKTFTIPGDSVNIYAMIDESIVTKATVGLSTALQAAINAYRFVPTTVQLQGDLTPVQDSNGLWRQTSYPVVPSWAGNDPAAVYFKTTQLKMQAALARWYK